MEAFGDCKQNKKNLHAAVDSPIFRAHNPTKHTPDTHSSIWLQPSARRYKSVSTKRSIKPLRKRINKPTPTTTKTNWTSAPKSALKSSANHQCHAASRLAPSSFLRLLSTVKTTPGQLALQLVRRDACSSSRTFLTLTRNSLPDGGLSPPQWNL